MLIPCISVAKLKKSACELCQPMCHGRCLSGVGHKLPSPLIFSSILATWGWTPQLHVIYPATTMLRPYSSCSSSGTCYRWWRESWSQRQNCKDFPINCNCQSWRFYQTVLHLQNHHSQQFIYNSWWQNIQTYSYRIHTDKCTPPWCQSNLREYQHIRNKHLFGPFARQSWC